MFSIKTKMNWRLNLLFIGFGYFVSLLIFQRGLLLKRHIVPARSSCFDVILQNSKSCWLPARFNRTIWLIVDALRYDFIDPISEVPTDGAKYFRGQMPLTAQLLALVNSGNETARLFRFISDAPTTTFQRVKALVTGNIPTFIEAGENFGAYEVSEDNIVDQIVNTGKNATFLGDDTWTQLLPNRFNRNFSFPSFDIYDLDLVDNYVIGQVYKEIERQDWSLLVAHVLGVDHCGHRYGPEHPEMRRKLRQMDELIFNITKVMPEDTLLAVMGDHGMTASGDHGGESRAELEAALFLYSKNGKLAILPETDIVVSEVDQIDLIPTMSLLLGVPIPFSNMGRLIESLIEPEHLSTALKLNAIQMLRYAQEYAQVEFSLQTILWPIVQNFEMASVENDCLLNRETITVTQHVLRAALQTIDLPMALVGVLSLIEAILFNVYIIFATFATSNGLQLKQVSLPQYLFRSAFYLLQVSLYLGGAKFTDGNGRRVDLLFFSVLTVIASLLYTLFTLFVHFLSAHNIWHTGSVLTAKHLVFTVAVLFQAFSCFSNSFVIYESSALRFLLQTFLFYILLKNLSKNRCRTRRVAKLTSAIKSVVFRSLFWRIENVVVALKIIFCMALVRLSNTFEICREEHVECKNKSVFYFGFFKTLPDLKQNGDKYATHVMFSILCLFVINFVLNRLNKTELKMLEKKTFVELGQSLRQTTQKKYTSSIPLALVRISSAMSWPMCFGVAIHWLCEFVAEYLARQIGTLTELNENQAIASKHLIQHFGTIGSQRSAQFVYALAFAQFFCIFLFSILLPKFATILFSAHRQLITVVLAMILGERLAFCFCLIVLLFVVMEDIMDNQETFDRTVFKYFLGWLAFYTFGHQATLPSIPWQAAFVGLPGNFWLKPVAGALIIVHLFAGNFLSILNTFCCMSTAVKTDGNVSRGEMQKTRLTSSAKSLNDSLRSEILVLLTLNAIRVLCSCLAGIALRKHLMFFKIFAPKLVFEAVNLLFCCVLTILYGFCNSLFLSHNY